MKTKVKVKAVNPREVEAIQAFNKILASKEGQYFYETTMYELEPKDCSTKASIKALNIADMLEFLKKGKAAMEKICAYLEEYGDVIG